MKETEENTKGISQKYITSDLHFHHKNIVKFTNRGVDTTQDEHDEWLINLWNSQVNKGDVVWHLGDFSFSKKLNEIENILRRLNGQKHFIMGNHCDEKIMLRLLGDNYIQSLQDYKEIKILGTKTCLFHFPIMSWNSQGRGSWHLHGHSHGSLKTSKGKMLDVGLDSAYNHYGVHKFFTEKDIETFMNKQEIYISDHHKEIKEL